MSKTQKTPFAGPLPTVCPLPVPDLDDEQKSKFDNLLKIVKSWKEIPSTKGKNGPITDDEVFWLTRECLLRYLRATRWNLAESVKRLLGTLTWRRDFDLENISGDYISPENETGKQILLGYDYQGRPCHYMFPKRQNTVSGRRQVEHVAFMIERAIDLMGLGQEKLVILLDFNAELSKTPSIADSKLILDIIQSHYPERLGAAFVINTPWAISAFFKVMTPFMDPLTRQKLKFNGDIRKFVPPEHLCKEFKGDLDFEYDHKTYWPALLQLCEEKRALRRERWEKAGKIYGISEAYLNGGDQTGLDK